MGIRFSQETLQNVAEFPAVITVDEITNGDYGEQWHLAYKPLTFSVGGATGVIHDYLSTKTISNRSKIGITMGSYLTVFGDNYVPEVGAGHLVGTFVYVRRYMHEFGKDRTTGEPIQSEIFIALRQLSEDEKKLTPPANTSNGPVVQAPTAAALSVQDMLDVAQLVQSTALGDAIAVAARSTLPAPLKAAVMSGDLLPAMVAGGYLDSSSGFYLITPQALAAISARNPAPAAPPVMRAPTTAPMPPAPTTLPVPGLGGAVLSPAPQAASPATSGLQIPGL